MSSRAIPLVGRAAEVDALERACARAAAGRSAVVVIEGEAGIGKSRLIDEAADLARARGFGVARAAGSEIDRLRPFGIVAEVLALSRTTDAARAAVGSRIRQDVPDADAAGRAHTLADDIVALVEAMALAEPLMLVLDDLHWADPGTCLVASQIGRRLTDLPLMLVLAARPDPRPPHLRAALDAIAPDATHLILAPLDDDATRALAEHVTGASPGASLSEHLRGTGGNPLFVAELLAALERDGALVTDSGMAEVGKPGLPPALGLVILRRFSYLDDRTLEVLRTAAVLGATFALTDLTTVLATTATEIAAPMETALRAGILVPAGERMRFRHDLLHEAIYGDIAEPIRVAVHQQAARALSAAGAPIEQVAAHYRLGAQRGDADAFDTLARAGRRALGTAPATAVTLLEAALEIAADDADRAGTELALALALRMSGDTPAAVRTLRASIDRSPEPLPAHELRLGALLGSTGDYAGSKQTLQTLADRNDVEPAIRARALAHLAETYALSDMANGEPVALAALDAARTAGDDHAQVVALTALANLVRWSGRLDEAIGHAREAVAIARASTDVAVRAEQPEVTLALLLSGPDPSEALSVIEAALRLGDAHGRIDHRPPLMKLRLGHAQARGEWTDLLAELQALIAISAQIGATEALGAARIQAAQVAAYQGQTTLAREIMAEHRATPGTNVPADTWPEYLVAWADGDAAGALRLLREARAVWAAAGAPAAPNMVDLVRLELLTGERARAIASVEGLEARLGATPPAALAAIATHCRALLDTHAGALLDLAARARDAGSLGRLPFVLEDAADALASASREPEAVATYQEALAGYESLGATWPAGRVEARLRSLGVRKGARGKRAGRPTTGWESLTPTEAKIVALVGEGLGNADIAARLFISTRTVESHLSHVYPKLGLDSRLALIRLAVEKAR